MSFAELKADGARLTRAQVTTHMRNMASDPRFAAFVAWLGAYEEDWLAASTSQKLAGDHGKMAHAAGSAYALRLLLRDLQCVVDKPARSSQQGLEPED